MKTSLIRNGCRSANLRQTRRINAGLASVIELIEQRVLLSTIAGWTTGSNSGVTASPFLAQTVDSSLANTPGLTRDTGLTATSLSKGFASSNWTLNGGPVNAGASTTDLYFDLTVKTGFDLALSEFDLNYRATSTGPKNAELDYSLNGGTSYTAINTAIGGAGFTTTSTFQTISPVSLTPIAALQNLTPGQTVRFRIVPYGGTASAGTFAVFDNGTSSIDLAVQGTPSAASVGTQTVQFDASTYSVNEGVGTATFTVDRNPANLTDLSGTETVTWTATNGTALEGTNFGTSGTSSPPLTGTATFNPSDTSKPFTIPIIDLNPQGGNKTFTITLSNPQITGASAGVGASLGVPAATTVTILDNAQSFALSSSSYSIDDTAGTADISVIRTGFLGDSADVAYTTTYSSAPSGTLHFNPNAQVAVISIPVTDTTGNTNFAINLTGVTPQAGSGDSTTLGTQTSATETIVDDGGITNSLTGLAAFADSIETTGFNSNSGFGSISGDPGPHPLILQILDFNKTSAPNLYPIGASTVTGISSLSLQLYNTATSGTFGGVVGNFNVYVEPDATTVASSGSAVKFIATGGSTGTGLDASQFTAPPILLGTFSFNNDIIGYDNFSAVNLNPAGVTAFETALNGGTTVRLAVSPDAIGTGGMFADWDGVFAGHTATLSLAATFSAQQVTFNIDTTATHTFTKGTDNFATITVDRSIANSDPASFQYTTSDGTGVSGTDYTGTSGSPITVNFPAGQTQATFQIPLLNNAAVFGDKNFTVTISNPTVGPGSAATLSGATSELVTILDPRTNDISSGASGEEIATVQPAGVRQNAGTTIANNFFNIEGIGNGSFASYAVADYNDFNNDSTDVFTVPAGTQVGTINEITFSAINSPDGTLTTNGLFNVYLVDDSTTSIANAGPNISTLTFQSSATTPPEGLGTQLNGTGSNYLLGSFNYDTTESTTAFTNFPLTTFNATAYAELTNDLNTSSKFRIVVTPAEGTASKEFAGFRGTETFNGVYEAPQISFNYTPTTVVAGPTWIDPATPAANYTWTPSPVNTLVVHGNIHIIADPGTDEPIITTDGSVSPSPVITADVSASGSLQPIDIGGLTLTGGASMIIDPISGRTATSHDVLTLESGGAFSIDSSSKLDLTTNDVDFLGGSLSSVTTSLHTGFNGGFWTGNGITSSTAAATPTLNTLGVGLSGSDVLVKYTYVGDADLSGTLTAGDYIAIDNGFNSNASGYANGDFNYDGVINGDDYSMIDNSYNTQGGITVASPLAQTAPASTPAATAVKSSVFATGAPIADSMTTDSLFDTTKKKSLVEDLLG